jgi:hypothetical protein
MNKFLILGEARSGTTTLSAIIGRCLYNENKEQDYPLLGEVFPVLFKSVADTNQIHQFVHDKKNGFIMKLPERSREIINKNIHNKEFKDFDYYYGLDAPQFFYDDVIELICKHHLGMKELIRHKIFVEKLLNATSKKDFKYIYTVRKNILAMSISIEICRQTDIWNIPPKTNFKKMLNKELRSKIDNHNIQPLNIETLEAINNYLAKRKNAIDERKNKDWITVNFKDLYSEKSSFEEKAKIFTEIANHIDLDIHSRKSLKGLSFKELIRKFFSNDKRVTTEKVYKKIPNLNEVLSHFNCSYDELIERY